MFLIKTIVAAILTVSLRVACGEDDCPPLLQPFVKEKAYTAQLPSNGHSNPKQTYTWSLQFCQDVGSPCPAGIAVCQKDKDHIYGIGVTAGEIATTEPNGENTDIIATFKPFVSPVDGVKRAGRVIIVCDKDHKEGFIESVSETKSNSMTSYTLTLRHSKACPETPHHPHTNGFDLGLSFGSVALIIILVGLIIYLVVGFLFCRFKQEKQGIEAIPNIDFWRDLPSLVADGFRFIGSKTCCRPALPSDYDQI